MTQFWKPFWFSCCLLQPFTTSFPMRPPLFATRPAKTTVQRKSQALQMSGFGIAENYTWKEEALEIEVSVQVPPGTQARNVHFKPSLTSIDLRVNTTQENQVVLLDGCRKLRGRISLDGTFWVFSDRRRSITVTLEKYFPHSNDDMQVLDYDWKGVYPQDEEEVSERAYDEPEILNVREYAASLGVDVDNINRSMVDETMFSSGLNLTQRTLDQLTEQGYLTEVTKQADGTEYKTNSESGEAELFSFQDEQKKDRKAKNKDHTRVNIPFLDSNSPWHQAVQVSIDTQTNKTTITDEMQLRKSLKQEAKKKLKNLQHNDEDEDDEADQSSSKKSLNPLKASDPIELLSVKKLKEILRRQGLKVSGTKKELQERLRNQVNSLLHSPESTTKGTEREL